MQYLCKGQAAAPLQTVFGACLKKKIKLIKSKN